jgi:hypothetical protein
MDLRVVSTWEATFAGEGAGAIAWVAREPIGKASINEALDVGEDCLNGIKLAFSRCECIRAKLTSGDLFIKGEAMNGAHKFSDSTFCGLCGTRLSGEGIFLKMSHKPFCQLNGIKGYDLSVKGMYFASDNAKDVYNACNTKYIAGALAVDIGVCKQD